MKTFRVRTYSIPAWVIALVLISAIVGAILVHGLSPPITSTLKVDEPLSIMSFPSEFNFFPGESQLFNVTVENSSPINYSVVLSFASNDSQYQARYLTFSKTVYNLTQGQQDLNASITVATDAPAATVTLSVNVVRLGPSQLPNETGLPVNGDFETGSFDGWNVEGTCAISNTTVYTGSYSAYLSDMSYDSRISQHFSTELPVDSGIAFQTAIYPFKVGSLGYLEYPYDTIYLFFSHASSGQPAFSVIYFWSWNLLGQDNTTNQASYWVNMNPLTWNLLSRNVTADVYAYFAGYNFSDIVLTSMSVWCHSSNGSPGSFYIDDIAISNSS